MARSGHRCGTILLLIVQAWIVPCHGFAFIPPACKPFLISSPHVPEAAPSTLCDVGRASTSPVSVAVVGIRSRGAGFSSRLSMSDGRGEPPLDELPPAGKRGDETGPGPYRDEHDSGGSRFRDLLARAKKVDPSIEQRVGVRPSPQGSPPPTRQQGATPAAALPRPVRPANAPNYDDPDSWDRIGSPDLPDPPLRNEMPGMQLPREMDYDAGGAVGDEGNPMGGTRFRNMMNQAHANDQRRQIDGPAGPRAGGEDAPSPRAQLFSPEDKARATRAAVERQQKLMMKAKGIDLDDPSLEGTELAKMKAISRAQAEAQSGYVPSSSGADDYLDQLKKDSKKRNKLIHTQMEGQPVSEEPDYPTIPEVKQQQPPERAPETAPRRRTKATTSIQNESDAYIAALSGIKVEITKNPYLEDQGTSNIIETGEEEPVAPKSKIQPPPPPRPTGPTMSYAEKRRKAREEEQRQERGGAVAASEPPSAPAQTLPPPSPAAPTVGPALSYTERLKQAREAKVAASGGAPTQTRPPPPPPPAAVGTSRAPVEVARERAEAAAPAPSRVVQQQQSAVDPFLGAEDDGPETKMMRVMDLLTEHKTAGLVGEARVAELRDALVDSREALRTETYGGSPPPVTATAPPIAAAAPPSATREQAPAAKVTPARPAAGAAAVGTAARGGGDKDTFRRCSALVQAHAHSSLSGNELMTLREVLIATLRIVENQIDNGGLFEDAWSVGNDSAPAVPAPADDISERPSGRSAPQATPPSDDDAPIVPASVGGIQSVGGVLSDMGVGNRPTRFEPEASPSPPPAVPARMSAAPGDPQAKGKGWTDGSLGEYEKSVATKGLGYLLKHRGGTGYGRGRVKGIEAENMIVALAELTEILHDEMVET